MAKLARKTLKLFSSTAANNGQFGSAQAGSPLVSADPTVIQSLSAWASGWVSAVIGGQKLPPLEEFQGVQYVHSYSTAYLFQEGMPEYDTGTTYFINSIVKKAGTLQLYGSITDNNTGNPLTDVVNWKLLLDLATPGNATPVGLVAPYAGLSAPSLWLLCFGQAISRTVYSALFAVIGTQYGIGDGTTTFNLPDLRGRIAAGRDNMGGSAAGILTATTMTPDGNTRGAIGGTETGTAPLAAHVHGPGSLTGNKDAGNNALSGATDFITGATVDSGNSISIAISGNTGSAGGSAVMPIVQPTIILNQIIYAGV